MQLKLELHINVEHDFETIRRSFRKTIFRNVTPTNGMFYNLEPYIFQVHEIWDDGSMFTNSLRLVEFESCTADEIGQIHRDLKQSGFQEYDPTSRRLQTEETGVDHSRT